MDTQTLLDHVHQVEKSTKLDFRTNKIAGTCFSKCVPKPKAVPLSQADKECIYQCTLSNLKSNDVVSQRSLFHSGRDGAIFSSDVPDYSRVLLCVGSVFFWTSLGCCSSLQT
ncbi:hypothetical protein QOT17_008775 [Balamuthia mandrillaris]